MVLHEVLFLHPQLLVLIHDRRKEEMEESIRTDPRTVRNGTFIVRRFMRGECILLVATTIRSVTPGQRNPAKLQLQLQAGGIYSSYESVGKYKSQRQDPGPSGRDRTRAQCKLGCPPFPGH
jgi:hypothetical protein